jgi:putative flippase GtrA
VRQLLRYALVGIGSNVAGFLAYLAITGLGVGPKLAMSCLYVAGASASFFGNRAWTFSHKGSVHASAVRFAMAHVLGYLLNLSILVLFVDHLGYPHQLVQAVAIVVVAFFLFALFRAFVFAPGRERERR